MDLSKKWRRLKLSLESRRRPLRNCRKKRKRIFLILLLTIYFDSLEKTIESIKKEAEDANTLKISKFRGSIAPLEDAAKTVDLQKAKLLDKVSEVIFFTALSLLINLIFKGEQNYEKSVNQLELLKEDLIGKFNQIQELTEKRDTLKKSFNDFKL
jgi:hypothetical protein